MDSKEVDSATSLCPFCNIALDVSEVRSAIWQADRLAVVEGIPALVCRSCGEQFYDDDVSDALRKLSESGFPQAESERTIEVPVFSLFGRIRERKPLPEDTYFD